MILYVIICGLYSLQINIYNIDIKYCSCKGGLCVNLCRLTDRS